MRKYDYRYIIGVESRYDGSVMYVNNFKQWKDNTGILHITKVDLAATPLLIPDLARAKAIARAVNGRIWRMPQEDMTQEDGHDEA